MMNLNLPPELTAQLQDEAYAILCRQSLADALAQLESEKEQIRATRPPFGFLASKKAREDFAAALRQAEENEQGLRSRLEQVEQLDHWLKASLEKQLHKHLANTNAEYRCCNEACSAIALWESGVQYLREKSIAFARDARAVATAIDAQQTAPAIAGRSTFEARLRAIATLRKTVESTESDLADIMEARERFNRLSANQGPDAAQLPKPPVFRTTGWVDRLALLTDVQVYDEVRRAEAEARAFCSNGILALFAQANEVRAACLDARVTVLHKLWNQLRSYAQAHFVFERDVDEVIAELTEHSVGSDLRRRHTFGGDPFLSER